MCHHLGSVRFEDHKQPKPLWIWVKFDQLVKKGVIPPNQVDKLSAQLADKLGTVAREEVIAWQHNVKGLIQPPSAIDDE